MSSPASRVAVAAVGLCLLAFAISVVGLAGSDHPGAAAPAPLGFEPNLGQTDPTVSFLARGPAGSIYLTRSEAVLALGRTDVLRMRLVGAQPAATITGAGVLPGRVGYLRPGIARTGPTFGAVVYRSVYPGVDLRFHGTAGQLEYDFDVAPRADPGAITVAMLGARALRLDPAGNLDVRLGASTLVEPAPRVYQEVGGERRTVAGRYVLDGHGRVGFALGPYDRGRPLVIDPTVRLGGAADAGRAIAVDRAGATYVTGDTSSAAFPSVHPVAGRHPGAGVEAFVTKLDPAGRVVYSTYLGGAHYTSGRGIAVDATGDPYVTGATNSTDFPTTRRALQRSYGGGPFDAFVTKLDRSGTALAYSTFLGDTHYDEGNAIAVDRRGRAVVAGRTVSPNFPAVGGLEPHVVSGAFVVRLDASGSALGYATVLGGASPANHGDTAFAVAVDPGGAAYVTGVTNSADLNLTHPVQASLGGGSDAFVAKIDAAGSAVVYCTYLGGAGDEIGRGIAADGDGNVYVTGQTTSSDFPTALPLQAVGGGGADAFVAKLTPDGGALVFSTYVGGRGDDAGAAIALDRARDVWVTGQTTSPDFPLAHATQHALAGAADAFVTEIDRTGRSVVRSTYLGGPGNDGGLGVAVDRRGGVHVTGQAGSRDFPGSGRGGVFVTSP
ncbi:MAG TPA: SBBP repeat-containing protein [Solirubrobacteraceae bacterium]|nr:SBBP repeat-containing protein [Solirubrobacteraceae bacterium]